MANAIPNRSRCFKGYSIFTLHSDFGLREKRKDLHIKNHTFWEGIING